MRETTMRCFGMGTMRRSFSLLALAFLPVAGWATNPDTFGYTGSNAVYSFSDISGGGAASVLGGTDDALAPLTLPFAFVFYGQSYTVVCASSNGALYFVPTLRHAWALTISQMWI